MPSRSLGSIGLIWTGAISSAVFALGAQLVLARNYSVADVGFMVTAMAVTNVVVPVAMMGTHWFLLDRAYVQVERVGSGGSTGSSSWRCR